MDYNFWGPFGMGFIVGAAVWGVILVAPFFIKQDDLDNVSKGADGDTELPQESSIADDILHHMRTDPGGEVSEAELKRLRAKFDREFSRSVRASDDKTPDPGGQE